MPEVMTQDEAESLVLKIIREHGPLTTKSLEEYTRSEGKRCPDGTLQFLTKLRFKGKIKGEISIQHRGWIWWIPSDDERN